MRLTELLQEIRKMRFEEAYGETMVSKLDGLLPESDF